MVYFDAASLTEPLTIPIQLLYVVVIKTESALALDKYIMVLCMVHMTIFLSSPFCFGKVCETVFINLFQGPLAIKVAKKAIDSGMQV